MGRYGKMPTDAEGFIYNKIENASIETSEQAKERILRETTSNRFAETALPHIRPIEGESIITWHRRTGPYIEFLNNRSIQTHINSKVMFWCHRNQKEPCFICEMQNVLTMMWETTAQYIQGLDPKLVPLAVYDIKTGTTAFRLPTTARTRT